MSLGLTTPGHWGCGGFGHPAQSSDESSLFFFFSFFLFLISCLITSERAQGEEGGVGCRIRAVGVLRLTSRKRASGGSGWWVDCQR